jgi:hypothetical protein
MEAIARVVVAIVLVVMPKRVTMNVVARLRCIRCVPHIISVAAGIDTSPPPTPMMVASMKLVGHMKALATERNSSAAKK